MNTVLRVEDLSVELAGGHAVDDVSFTVPAGETFALLGESGCGKSMTALAVMRLLPAVAKLKGQAVDFAGQNLLSLTEAEMRSVRGGGIGMIFQEPATSLNPVMTIGKQIGEVLSLHRQLNGDVARHRASELLAAVGLPDPVRRLDEYPFQLSGGMKQRVMIAMALAGEPRFLIADEPTTALDVTIQAQVLDLLQKLQRERGMGMLLITHDLGVVERMADHIGVMYAGHLIEVAPRQSFFAAPAHPYTRKLFAALPERASHGQRLATIPGSVPPLTTQHLGCRFASRCEQVMAQCHDQLPAWHTLPNGGQVRCHLYAEGQVIAAAPVEPKVATDVASHDESVSSLLDVDALQVHFPIRRGLLQRTVGYVRAVDGVSLRVQAGRTLALVGESGCGKTTVGKAILQLIRSTGGQVKLAGRRIDTLAPRDLRPLRADMQMIFQDPFASLNPRLRVGDIIAEGMRALGQVINRAEIDARVSDLLVQVGLRADMADRYPHEFSGGQRQRIAIARALAVNPKLLICDEPTSALDVSVQAQIVNLLHDLQARLGLAYLFITHNIAVVDYLADDVAVMYLGRIVEQGRAEQVLQHPAHPYTQALLAAALSRGGGADTPVHTLQGANEGMSDIAQPAHGEMPSAANPPSGCHFHPRCPQAMDICRQRYPTETQLLHGHVVHCWLHKDSLN